MAYGKRKTRKAPSRRRGSTRRPARSTRSVRRPARRARKSPVRRSGSGGGRTIRIEVVQAPPSNLSPLTQMLLDQKKIVEPRRARF